MAHGQVWQHQSLIEPRNPWQKGPQQSPMQKLQGKFDV
jgi:hypothetical protein